MKRVSPQRKSDSIEKKLWDKIKNFVKRSCILKDEKSDVAHHFAYMYPNLWREVEDFHNDMMRWNKERKLHGNSITYSFRSPYEWLNRKHFKTSAGGCLDEEDRKKQVEEIRRHSLTLLHATNIKTELRERYKQIVEPSYVRQHKLAYFTHRKKYPQDIDTRYLIIHELAKYKCDATISFLESLVRCEKNLPLQHYAWECLNSLGVYGVHKGRRPGKKRPSHLKGFKPLTTPQDLLNAIYNSPLEQMKHYDIFLSHSYKDYADLLKLKTYLNSQGLHVYMDWVNDRDELQRDKTCAETAAVITERILACKVILYIHTDNSLTSQWTPWELGFAYAHHIPIIVYQPKPVPQFPEYLQLYLQAERSDDQLVINNGNECMPLMEYISTLKSKNNGTKTIYRR